jgi:hypothetical protein
VATPANHRKTAALYGRPATVTSAAHPKLWVGCYQLDARQVPAHAHAEHLLLLHQGQALRYDMADAATYAPLPLPVLGIGSHVSYENMR